MVLNIAKEIIANKQYLSDIDGLIGDGDHGVNMAKGFTICIEEIEASPDSLTGSLKTLSRILMNEIGGSMGPLYGYFFRSMAKTLGDNEEINIRLLSDMLQSGLDSIKDIGGANLGDKTMLDCLIPAVAALKEELNNGSSEEVALSVMKEAAIAGRDNTKDMVAKVGRASRLGERSRGVPDAGSCSCCLILCSIADSYLHYSRYS